MVFFKCTRGSIFFAAFEREMLSAVTAIQVTLDGVVREQASQRKLLNLLMTSSASAEVNVELPDDLTFPLTSVEDVEELEVKLLDKTIKNLVVSICTIMFVV